MLKRGIGILVALLVVAMAGQVAAEPPEKLSGWFVTIWPDAHHELTSDRAHYFLIREEEWTELAVDEKSISQYGSLTDFDRKPVVLEGRWENDSSAASAVAQDGGMDPKFRVQSIRREREYGESSLLAPLTAEPQAAVIGSQPWVSILCRFADATGVTPRERPWFEELMLGWNAPSMGHYFSELSYGQINLAGSQVVGWYNLPQPRSYYVYDGNGDGVEDADLGRLANDCAEVADAEVYFPQFAGVNFMFNDSIGNAVWGGAAFIALDGGKVLGVTWLSPWGYENQGALAHEMGHGFGLPHSSGPYGFTYDSRWDVMSGPTNNCSPPDVYFGCVGVHTISFHKDLLGWIPSGLQYVAAPGSSATIELERLAQPSGVGYLMAKIPISGERFYSVETRQLVGRYDALLPGSAAVIHEIDTARWSSLAQVVDPDGNGDPNDEGAMWRPGEIFVDSANLIGVEVGAATAAGFQVTITRFTSTPYILIVTSAGTGTGGVVGSGINCGTDGTDCQGIYTVGTVVALSATAAPGSIFRGFSGDPDCTDGQVTMNANKACIATFAPPIGPDLTGNWNSVIQSCRKGKCALKGSGWVVNQGNMAAPASRVRVFLSDDAVLDSGDTAIKELKVKKITAGGSKTFKLKVTLPAGVTATGKYLIALVDAWGGVSESNEANNASAYGPMQ